MDGSYHVKYILTGRKDNGVPKEFVELMPDTLNSRGRRRVDQEGLPKSSFKSESKVAKAKRGEQAPDTESKHIELPQLCILTTLLSDSMHSKLATFQDLFSCASSTVYSSQVTHLVVETDDKRVIQQRTMKYLKTMTG